MANSLYDNARKLFLEAGLNWLTDTVRGFLLSATYTLDLTNHLYLSSVAGGARVSGPVSFGTKATTGGAAAADNLVFGAVTGAQVTRIIFYKDTGAEGTSPLIGNIDSATGLPITPNGGDIIVTWDTGTNKIFRP
jgi:hypothetical protein